MTPGPTAEQIVEYQLGDLANHPQDLLEFMEESMEGFMLNGGATPEWETYCAERLRWIRWELQRRSTAP